MAACSDMKMVASLAARSAGWMVASMAESKAVKMDASRVVQ